jgi:hypothetical protein
MNKIEQILNEYSSRKFNIFNSENHAFMWEYKDREIASLWKHLTDSKMLPELVDFFNSNSGFNVIAEISLIMAIRTAETNCNNSGVKSKVSLRLNLEQSG